MCKNAVAIVVLLIIISNMHHQFCPPLSTWLWKCMKTSWSLIL